MNKKSIHVQNPIINPFVFISKPTFLLKHKRTLFALRKHFVLLTVTYFSFKRNPASHGNQFSFVIAGLTQRF